MNSHSELISIKPLWNTTALALMKVKVLLPKRTVRQMLVDFIWDTSGQIQSILLNYHFKSHHAITKWPKRQFDQLLTGTDRNFISDLIVFHVMCVSTNWVSQFRTYISYWENHWIWMSQYFTQMTLNADSHCGYSHDIWSTILFWLLLVIQSQWVVNNFIKSIK